MDFTLFTQASLGCSLQILKHWTWVHMNIKQFSINLSKLQWSIESDKLIFIFSACRCKRARVRPLLGLYIQYFSTLFESLYFQNYCCYTYDDKMMHSGWMDEQESGRVREWVKSILCSSAIKRKHNSIVRIFIEQASILKVHLIKLCTFKLHTLALTLATLGFQQRDEQWIYEICIRVILKAHTLCLKSISNPEPSNFCCCAHPFIQYHAVLIWWCSVHQFTRSLVLHFRLLLGFRCSSFILPVSDKHT